MDNVIDLNERRLMRAIKDTCRMLDSAEATSTHVFHPLYGWIVWEGVTTLAGHRFYHDLMKAPELEDPA